MTSAIDSRKAVKVLGRILIVVLLIAAAILSRRFEFFLDISGVIFMLLGVVSMALMGFSNREIFIAFRHAAGGPGSRPELRKSAYFWEAGARNAVVLGALGSITSFILLLSNLMGKSQGGLSGFLAAAAVSFLPALTD